MNANDLKDHRIRQSYLKAVKRNSAHHTVIDIDEATDIVVAAIGNNGIRVREFADLKRIYDHAKLGPKAKDYVAFFLNDWRKQKKKLIPAGAKLLDADRLKKTVVNILTGMTSSVEFVHPFKFYIYNPAMYQKIAKLIDEGLIGIFLNNAPRGWGLYERVSDIIVMPRYEHNLGWQSQFVHEVTHAIQDWTNRKMRMDGAEVDAYIAQAIFFRSHSGTRMRSPRDKAMDAVFQAADVAARQVLRGNSVSEQQWKNLLSQIQKHPKYSSFRNYWTNPKREEGVKYASWETKKFHSQ